MTQTQQQLESTATSATVQPVLLPARTGKTDNLRPEEKKEVARQLLVELLAHQFAYPVKWIESQDVLLTDASLRRFVELGPSNVLTNMARKTRESKYSTMDTALGLERQFLSATRDSDKVQYRYADEPVVEAAPAEAPPAATSAPAAAAPAAAAPVAAAHVAAAASVPDAPVTALEVIRALVAYKLKKALSHVQASKTIKELVGGRSTLQNELVGDVTSEFGSAPDRAEDLALSALAEGLPAPSTAPMGGKVMSTLLGRWIAAAMPGGFAAAQIKTHLGQRFGLDGPGRQLGVLLIALVNHTATGAGRLASADAAKEMLDSAAQEYAKEAGVTLSTASAAPGGAQASSAVNVDPSLLEGLKDEPRRMATAQYEALARYLGIEDKLSPQNDALKASMGDQQARLDAWLAEFGDDFESGIKPCFDSRKQRKFNFFWNQARLDVLDLFRQAKAGELKNIDEKAIAQLADKCSETSLFLSLGLAKTDAANGPTSVPAASSTLGRQLAAAIGESLERGFPKCRFSGEATRPTTRVLEDGTIKFKDVPRTTASGEPMTYTRLVRDWNATHTTPAVCMKSQVKGAWESDAAMTEDFLQAIGGAVSDGLSFAGRTFLVTGAGIGSIGGEMVKRLLMGGATVIVTTSREIADAQEGFRKMYAEFGARDSELFVFPFNQGSIRDCQGIIDYIMSPDGLNLHIDALLPLAAVPEKGIEVDGLGDWSELAHRLMMTNVMRLIGMIAQRKAADNTWRGRQTQVLLPLSPNHGIFGGDGLYSESKLGLEGLLNRVSSESWGDRIAVCGVIIGWTRGTGLMAANDIVAEAIEKEGALTFTSQEMAMNMLTLLSPEVSAWWEDRALVADFAGCLAEVADLKGTTATARASMQEESEIKRMIAEEDKREQSLLSGSAGEAKKKNKEEAAPGVGSFHMEFPRLPDYNRELLPLAHLRDMADLSSTVVVVGYSELGPWGSARTRWQMEVARKLTQQGYIELAWCMGLIKHVVGEKHIGWSDAKTKEPLTDAQIPQKFGKFILENAGIRMITPESSGGYDPANKDMVQDIAVETDLPPFNTDRVTAESFRRKHGANVIITSLDEEGGDMVRVQIKAGARILVPKSVGVPYSTVAGLLPTGWDPKSYGIPDDTIDQVDSLTLYSLCCAAEALLSAGITDPAELFAYMHVSEVGNFLGSSLGGTQKNREMFRDVYLDKQVQGDVLQETNLNTPAAWVNMLLLGASGPIKTPVGACATAMESLDNGVDSIWSGKTKVCLVGGTDSFHEDESFAFSTMKATVDAEKQFAQGRRPNEMSRPTAETRGGFLEGEGCGVQILASAEVAIKMGLPIYAIVAGSGMASDKIGRSLPAPGKGVLTFARESASARNSPLLDVSYRRRQLRAAQGLLEADSDTCSLSSSSTASLTDSDLPSLDGLASVSSHQKLLLRQWTTDFRRLDPSISPMRAALAVWGLTIDDIGIVSLHGTSTKANDLNEPATLHAQMTHLGRSPTAGPLFAMAQKGITGHPKAPAASWMLNGCIQVLQTGLVPGTMSCDNIDPALAQYTHLVFPRETAEVSDVRAFMLSSFGFGQKGAQMVGVAPRYVLATLPEPAYRAYAARCEDRMRTADCAFARAILGEGIVKAKDHSAYRDEDLSLVLLNPLSRTKEVRKGVWEFDPKDLAAAPEEEEEEEEELDLTVPPTPAIVDARRIPYVASGEVIKTNPMDFVVVGDRTWANGGVLSQLPEA
ncbi:hypothetical protein GQ53DRAFT_810530 [Thozetella sp. PMI_491]|nr:hypothetical protein GQ53DRAFT_810530 [Thozetella sp. PMI_491]